MAARLLLCFARIKAAGREAKNTLRVWAADVPVCPIAVTYGLRERTPRQSSTVATKEQLAHWAIFKGSALGVPWRGPALPLDRKVVISWLSLRHTHSTCKGLIAIIGAEIELGAIKADGRAVSLLILGDIDI